MDVYSVISSALSTKIDAASVTALAETQKEADIRDVLFKISDKIIEVEKLIASGSVLSLGGQNSMKVAVYVARHLDGTAHVGWHYTHIDTVPGDRFHFNHGLCTSTSQNRDGQYVWFAPIKVYVNFSFNKDTNAFDEDWITCFVNLNVQPPINLTYLAVFRALEDKVLDRPAIAYVSLTDPVNIDKPVKVNSLELGYEQ